MACQAVVEVCCLKMKAQKQCTQGKQIARIRQSCDALHSQLGKAHARVGGSLTLYCLYTNLDLFLYKLKSKL